jgi:hypothetical protein
VIGLVAVISTIFKRLLESSEHKKKESATMKQESMSVRLCSASLFDCIAAIGTIAAGDALLT